MDYTDDEIADAGRDLMALLRAHLSGDKAGVEAIACGVSGREASALLTALAGSTGDLLVRLTCAAALIEGRPELAVILGADCSVLMAAPSVRAAVLRNVENVQAGLVRGG